MIIILSFESVILPLWYNHKQQDIASDMRSKSSSVGGDGLLGSKFDTSDTLGVGVGLGAACNLGVGVGLVIEAKVSRCFDEMVEIDYGGDDFHDPTTNVRRRCALAIAKPTPRGY